MTYHNAHAARVDNGIVREVIVIPYQGDTDEAVTAYCNSIGLAGTWLDTSYTGSRRSKYAGIGDFYDADLDEFVTPEITEILTEAESVTPPSDDDASA
jgi:hypothetical protein